MMLIDSIHLRYEYLETNETAQPIVIHCHSLLWLEEKRSPPCSPRPMIQRLMEQRPYCDTSIPSDLSMLRRNEHILLSFVSSTLDDHSETIAETNN
jgi:hypothetical protein